MSKEAEASVRNSQARGIMARVQITTALGDAIRELTEINGGVPSGVLYAQVAGHLTLDLYNDCINALKETKLVEEKGHFLKWIGPK